MRNTGDPRAATELVAISATCEETIDQKRALRSKKSFAVHECDIATALSGEPI
jgi:hypothetical protein